MLADLHSAGTLHDLVVCLIVVALVALFVYVGCHLAGRPDWGRIGAAVVVIVGALLCLL
jgi:hypothetical protein